MYTVYTNIISIFGINPVNGAAVILQVAVCKTFTRVVLLKGGNNDVCVSVTTPASGPVRLIRVELWVFVDMCEQSAAQPSEHLRVIQV